MKRLYVSFLFFLGLFTAYYLAVSKKANCKSIPMYFCTAADEQFFNHLINLIGSLHKTNFEHIEEIAVFNLGLTEANKKFLEKIDKVRLYELERANPYILTPMKVDSQGKMARGLYSWKPVMIKQSLEKFPYVLCIDAGTTVLGPLNPLFEQIGGKGYFFEFCGHSVRCMLTKRVIDKLDLESRDRRWILDDKTYGISAGFQGLSKKMLKPYVMPVYELSRDIENFVDDGSALGGFGSSRHDQSLFSVYVHLLRLDVSCAAFPKSFKGFLLRVGNVVLRRLKVGNFFSKERSYALEVGGRSKEFYITINKEDVFDKTAIYHSRSDTNLPYFKQFIRYKDTKKGYV